MASALYLEAAGATDVGRVREHNEDSLSVDSQTGLYAIADGMGGHTSGDVASQTTLTELQLQIERRTKSLSTSNNQDGYYNIVLDAIAACNETILNKNSENGLRPGTGMGTTLVGAYFLQDNTTAVIFNVGDSRLYRLRSGVLEQLTRDHSMYQDWHDAGEEGEAPPKNILSRAIGLMQNTLPDLTIESISERDVYLMCSDGLSNLIDTETLQAFLNYNQHLSAQVICQDLVDIANENGGHDNISVLIIKTKGSSSSEIVTEEVTLQRSVDQNNVHKS